MPTPSATAPAFSLFHASEPLVEQFAAVFTVVQQEQARLMRLAAAMAAAVPDAQREFVGDDLALVMNVHPRTGTAFVHQSVAADRLGLLQPMEAGELTQRHVAAVVEEVQRWAPEEDQQAEVVALVLERVRARLGVDGAWPTPGQLRKRVQAAALLLDLTAAEKAKKGVADRRGVACFPSAVGEGTLSVSGPEVQVVAMAEAIRARAEALGRLPGDERSLQQRMFDACYDLLLVDAVGGESRVPALDVEGVPVTIRVRGIEIQVVMPYSVATGGDLELAEIPGYGPLLPSTAREVLADAEALRRVAVDAATGEVLAVEDRVPVRRDRRPSSVPEPVSAVPTPAAEPRDDQPPAEPSPAEAPTTDSWVEHALALIADSPVRFVGEQGNEGYRIASRTLRAARTRDRTCTFPGCTTPARWTDTDHREPWPHGPTSTANLHCLCRHHHRGKQAYFAVQLDLSGHTVWTTPDGRRYRRPPPRF